VVQSTGSSPGLRQSRGLHQMSEHAYHLNLAPALTDAAAWRRPTMSGRRTNGTNRDFDGTLGSSQPEQRYGRSPPVARSGLPNVAARNVPLASFSKSCQAVAGIDCEEPAVPLTLEQWWRIFIEAATSHPPAPSPRMRGRAPDHRTWLEAFLEAAGASAVDQASGQRHDQRETVVHGHQAERQDVQQLGREQ
jgi:hypothetical protein